MSISAIFGAPIATVPCRSAVATKAPARIGGGMVIECSSRPTKKATAHHMKTRPRKKQPWDIKRKPTVYPPLPPLPPDWTLTEPVSGADVASTTTQLPATAE